MKPDRVNVIGLGGIGCCLMNVLPRWLASDFPETELTLFDGDAYEARNAFRQVFDREGNKAEVTAERVRQEFLRLTVYSVPEFITTENTTLYIQEGDCTLLCADNHWTRRIVSERVSELENGVLISGGCRYEDGIAILYVRRNGTDVTLPLTSDKHPEIRDATPDQGPRGGPGCMAEAQPASTQLLLTNNTVAALMLDILYGVLKGRIGLDEVPCDILTATAAPRDYTGHLHRLLGVRKP